MIDGRMGRILVIVVSLVFSSGGQNSPTGLKAAPPAGIDFNRSIRPILSNNCFKCHGPDAAERKAGLRLDRHDGATGPSESGAVAVVPGDTAHSELIRRIDSEDPDERMPPADSGKTLTAEERQLLRRWIESGGRYDSHWSFVAPVQSALPAVRDEKWSRSPLDRFILSRLESEGLRPSTEADRVTLARRLYLDLLGLPPTPEQIDAFVQDRSPNAYERLVDRLLDNPHFGERMALDWLDAARFADTHGFHIDSGRDMTRWREWVIDSFNGNRPFDQFIVDQIAGDLLPNPTVAQRVASGFHRNHMINFEGGAIPQEYHTAYIVDRVNTTGTVFLGLTVACVQCHDHKYDPITQREYYQLFAFFHNVPENGLDGSKGNAAPMIRVPNASQQAQIEQLTDQVGQLQRKISEPDPEQDAEQLRWETSAGGPLVRWVSLDDIAAVAEGGASIAMDPKDGALVVSGPNPASDRYEITGKVALSNVTGVRLELLPDDKLPNKGPGRSENGNVVLTNVSLLTGPTATNLSPAKFANATADFSQKDFAIERAIDDQVESGWAIYPETAKAHHAIFKLAESRVNSAGQHLKIVLDFRSSYSRHQAGRFRVMVTDADDPNAAALPRPIQVILDLVREQRSAAQTKELREYFRANVSSAGKTIRARIEELQKQLKAMETSIPTAMVMQEMENPRDTFVLIRGQYDKPGDKVQAGVPAFLPALPKGAPDNRLGLARWLVDPAQPLTARVTVNRFWQSFFGVGLVKTAEDFGSQGEAPSHPELLDWLAVEFRMGEQVIGHPWDVKGFVRMLVTSSTYRQKSVVTQELQARDPENRLLAHAPRYRLPAEFIRDQALAVSGLLDDRIGGLSVSPYQPPGIWEELASRADGKNWTAQEYSQSHGADLYRRTMYTFWKRTAPPPTLIAFDAPDRETCVVRRARTNTPLQALILMNDPTYVEAARKLGERIVREGGENESQRITFAFRTVLGRPPSADEIQVLSDVYRRQRDLSQKSQQSLKLLAVGESPVDQRVDPTDLAAWTIVASVLLNLDETLTKG